MLVLSRKLNEKIHLGDNITVTVLRVQGNTIRLGIDAPRDVRILRGELEPLDNHRNTKDQLFKVISDVPSVDVDSEPVSGEPASAESATKEDICDGESDKARPAGALASFVSAAHKPHAILHQTL